MRLSTLKTLFTKLHSAYFVMKNILLSGLLLVSLSTTAQTGSEIYLFDLTVRKENVQLANGKNITKHIGYDNQPHFHTDLPLLYYSSFNDAGRADIVGYNFKTKETKPITNTEDREYSPTLTPDKRYISCILQRDNGAQDLVKYPVDGGEPTVIIDNLIVGYHTWVDSAHLALFILGKDNAPATLHYYNLQTKRDTILAEDIGRSLHKIPGKNAISFIHKVSKTDWFVKQLNTETLAIETIAPISPGKEDIAWTPSGLLLFSNGEKIFVRVNNSWQEVTMATSTELKGITRMAVRADGKKLALVVSE
jgi:hypothetical protein